MKSPENAADAARKTVNNAVRNSGLSYSKVGLLRKSLVGGRK